LGLLAEGFRAIKLRVHSETIREDLALVTAVKEAVGTKMEILVDANQAQTPVTPSGQDGVVWDRRRALHMAKALEELDVQWLEEPLSRFDHEGRTMIRSKSAIRIAIGEHNQYFHEFKDLLDGCDVVQPDALYSEGIGQMRKIAALAEFHARWCVPHHAGGGIGALANLHFAASVPNCPYVEIMRDRPGERLPSQELLANNLVPGADGYIKVQDAPGFGIAIDEEYYAHHAQREDP
jgi:L-alanine-DL-glutamate epimerase-like enolase superfamily enzyme